MITPYLPTLNLSVDNALSTQQIIHQLITQINTMSKYLNDMDLHTEEVVTEKITKALLEFETTVDTKVQKALDEGKQYTDIKISDVNNHFIEIESKIIQLQNRVLALETELPETEKKLIKMINNAVKRLENKMERMLKESVAVVSPYTGLTVSVQEGLYDAKKCAQELWSMSINDILALTYTQSMTNRIGGTWENAITDVDTFIRTRSFVEPINHFDAYFNQKTEYMESTWRNFEYFTREYVMSRGKKLINVSDGEYVNGQISYTIGQTIGLTDQYASDNIVALPQWTNLTKVINKDELRLAVDLGLLNSDYTAKESGIYPL